MNKLPHVLILAFWAALAFTLVAFALTGCFSDPPDAGARAQEPDTLRDHRRPARDHRTVDDAQGVTSSPDTRPSSEDWRPRPVLVSRLDASGGRLFGDRQCERGDFDCRGRLPTSGHFYPGQPVDLIFVPDDGAPFALVNLAPSSSQHTIARMASLGFTGEGSIHSEIQHFEPTAMVWAGECWRPWGLPTYRVLNWRVLGDADDYSFLVLSATGVFPESFIRVGGQDPECSAPMHLGTYCGPGSIYAQPADIDPTPNYTPLCEVE